MDSFGDGQRRSARPRVALVPVTIAIADLQQISTAQCAARLPGPLPRAPDRRVWLSLRSVLVELVGAVALDPQ